MFSYRGLSVTGGTVAQCGRSKVLGNFRVSAILMLWRPHICSLRSLQFGHNNAERKQSGPRVPSSIGCADDRQILSDGVAFPQRQDKAMLRVRANVVPYMLQHRSKTRYSPLRLATSITALRRLFVATSLALNAGKRTFSIARFR